MVGTAVGTTTVMTRATITIISSVVYPIPVLVDSIVLVVAFSSAIASSPLVAFLLLKLFSFFLDKMAVFHFVNS